MTEQRSGSQADDELSFSMTLDEANLVMEALGELAFSRVCELIAKLQAQGRSQLASNGAGASAPVATDEGEQGS